MGARREAARSLPFAAFQSAVYFAFLRYAPERPSPWCSREWATTDCLVEEGRRAMRSNGTDLQVVLPGYSQTGTSSVMAALRELGYRAYHADDYSSFGRSVMFDRIDARSWSRAVTRCRMEAISLEPTVDTVGLAVATSPEAKFILTWRTYASWKKSTRNARIREVRWSVILKGLKQGNKLLPWIEAWDRLSGVVRRVRQSGDPFFQSDSLVVALVYRTICNGYGLPITGLTNRGVYKSHGNEEAYLGHQNEVRTLVPPERLLEFDASRHGWAELERFLGRRSGRAEAPFPHTRTKGMRTNDAVMERNFHRTRWALLTFPVLHALSASLLAAALRSLIRLLVLLDRRL